MTFFPSRCSFGEERQLTHDKLLVRAQLPLPNVTMFVFEHLLQVIATMVNGKLLCLIYTLISLKECCARTILFCYNDPVGLQLTSFYKFMFNALLSAWFQTWRGKIYICKISHIRGMPRFTRQESFGSTVREPLAFFKYETYLSIPPLSCFLKPERFTLQESFGTR